jgi:ferredoxin-nitrate reductase
VAARVSDIRPGAVFVPFHYGDVDRDGRPTRAANELTIAAWDPVSKQPAFKGGAVRVTRVGPGSRPSPAPDGTASAPATRRA